MDCDARTTRSLEKVWNQILGKWRSKIYWYYSPRSGVYGLQRNEEERKANILRLEVVAQRDGPPIAQSYFEVDPKLQFARELTRKEVEEIENINKTMMTDSYGMEEEGTDRRGDV